MRRVIQLLRVVLLVFLAVLLLKVLVWDRRIVGEVEGIFLTYEGAVYREYSLSGWQVGERLGRVRFDDSFTAYLYAVEGEPDWLHVSFGWDGREYVRESEARPGGIF